MNRTAAFFLLVVGMASGIAQDSPKPGTLLGEERRVRDEIETADRLAAEGRIEDALRRYQQTLAESGDVFVSLAPQDPRRALPARWLIHSRIAALPAEARRLYRRSVEERVKPWLEQGRSQRDPALLEQIVTEAFCSESAEPALLLLGDLASERGEFELAEHYWLMLADYPAARSAEGTAEPRTRLRHPDVQGSEAVVQARLILSLLLRGEKAAAKSQWEAFRTKHPEAQGDLAGRSGRLADTLGGLLDSDLAFRQAGGGGIWPTFGGDSTRGRVIPAGTVPYWPDVPTWRSSIPGEQAVRAHRETDPPLGVASMARSLAFHPVIIPGYALIADAARIFVYRLNDGRLVGSYDHRLTAGLPLSLDLRVPTRSDLAYTLTVSGDRIYARFGAQTMAPPDAGAAGVESESVIACLEWRRTGDDRVRMIPRWQLRARTLDSDPPALFEGAPIVRDGRMYLARTRFEGRQAVTSIECYDADSLDQREPPIRRWRQEIWSVEMGSDRPRQRHDLLTMAGTNVVFCTHSGAIIALDALTGRRAWAFRYGTSPPRSTDGLLPRDLAPCLYAAGRVYAVPADADRIFCLDARSGELIWDSGPTYAIHLLGVSNGRLFATLGGFPQGLRAYDAAKGTVLWTKPDEGDRATFGRGLVSDQFVFWPTRMGLRVLHQEDGEPADARSSAEPWGNLAFADGYVIVTTPTEIWGFVPPRAQLGRRQSEAEQNPDDALRQYELAIAQADAGDRAAALQSLANAAQSAQDHDDRFGQPLKKLISLRRRELLESDWKNAAVSVASTAGDVLAQARDAELDAVDRIRLWILRRALGDRSFPEILETPEIHRLWLTKEDGSPIRADAYLIGLLDGEARAVWDRRAEQQWQGERSRPLTQAVERLSFSPAVRKALLEEARRREAHEADSAAVAYRSVLAGTLRAPPDAESARERVAAIEGLLRVYEANGATDAMRAMRWRLQPERDESPAFLNRPAQDRSQLDWPTSWAIEEGAYLGDERPLAPMPNWESPGVAATPDSEGRVFFCANRTIVCRKMPRGTEVWRQPLAHDAESVGVYGDSVIVLGQEGASRLRRDTGQVIWEFLSPAWDAGVGAASHPMLRLLEPWPQSAPLSNPCLAGPRLICRRGEQAILALDLETGQVEWQFRVPGSDWFSPEEGAGIRCPFLATPRYVLLQTTGGEAFCLDATTGRLLFRRPAALPWLGPPVLGDHRWAIFADGPNLRAINLSDGSQRWSYTPKGWPSLTGAAPELTRDGRHLVGIWSRNYGEELIRLDIDNGREIHPPTRLGREHFCLAASTASSKTGVYVGETTAVAVDRDTGRRLWEVPLPGVGSWHARTYRNAVVLHPASPSPRSDPNDLEKRARELISGVPSFRGLQEAWNVLTWGAQRRVVTLHALNPTDGRSMHAHALSADGPDILVLHEKDAAAVISGKQWYVLRPR